MEMSKKEHKKWLDNEYKLWEAALMEVEFEKFKQHPQVIRMMGLDDYHLEFVPLIKDWDLPWKELEALDKIGAPMRVTDVAGVEISGIGLRFIYYAKKVLDIIKDTADANILEIGGGYGGFAATLFLIERSRTPDHWNISLYTIYDLPVALQFQQKYFKVIDKASIINRQGLTHGIPELYYDSNYAREYSGGYDFLVSFYALGEFTDEMKEKYIRNVIAKVPHGYIIWNAHSGASDYGIDLIKEFHPHVQICEDEKIFGKGCKEIKW